MKHFLTTLLILSAAFAFYRCEDPFTRFEKPASLSIDNIRTLQDSGVFNHYLALMERAEMKTAVENQLFALFVPDDKAFEAYFMERGIIGVNDLTQREALELFGLHLLINPRNREQLVYEFYYGELQSPKKEYGSLFLRKRSYSISLPYQEEVKYFPTYKGQTVNIWYNDNVLVPLFSDEFLKDYNMTSDDYLFMYPGSQWTGTQWHNAAVTKSETPTASGFIYYIDQVVNPTMTIDKYLLSNQEKFSLFYDLMQRFATYFPFSYEEEIYYLKSYSQIPNFANPIGPSGDGTARYLHQFSLLVPNNQAVQAYFDNKLLKTYPSIDEVPNQLISMFLQAHGINVFVTPSKIKDGFINALGQTAPIDINSDIISTFMANNGVVFELNKVIEPELFFSVVSPLIFSPEFRTLYYAMVAEGVDLITTLSTKHTQFTILAPDDASLEDYGLIYDELPGGVIILERQKNNQWVSINVNPDLLRFTGDHYILGRVENFDGEGFIQLASGNHIYYNNGSIYGGGNTIPGDKIGIVAKNDDLLNGILYQIDKPVKKPLTPAQYLESSTDHSLFFALLDKVDLITRRTSIYDASDTIPEIVFWGSVQTAFPQWTIFAPDNQAITEAIATNVIDTAMAGLSLADQQVKKETLAQALRYHFVRNVAIFDDGKVSGVVSSNRLISGTNTYSGLTVSNSLHNLTVVDLTGQSAPVSHSKANALVEFGVVHSISKFLKFE